MNDDWQERQRQEQEREEQRRRDEQHWQEQQREERRRHDEQRWQEEQRLDQQRREREENDRLLYQQRQREQEQQYRRELAREAEERRVQHAHEYNEDLRRREAEEARRRSTPSRNPFEFGGAPPGGFEPARHQPSPPRPGAPSHPGAPYPRHFDVEPYRPSDEPRSRGRSTRGSAGPRWLAVSVVVLGVLALAIVGVRFAEDFLRQRSQAAASARLEADARARVEIARRNLSAMKPAARRFLLAGLADPVMRERVAGYLPRCYGSVLMMPVPKAVETLRRSARSSPELARLSQDAALQFALIEACVLSGAPARGFDLKEWTPVFKPIYYEAPDRSMRAELNLLDGSGETRAGAAADARRLAALIPVVVRQAGAPDR